MRVMCSYLSVGCLEPSWTLTVGLLVAVSHFGRLIIMR